MAKGNETGNEILRYQVPDHQDSTVLLTALAEHGFQATGDYAHGTTLLSIVCTGDPSVQREQVRALLADLHDSTLGGPHLIYGPVRFEDETGDEPHAVPSATTSTSRAGQDDDEAPATTGPTERARRGWAPVLRAGWGLLLLGRTEQMCRIAAVDPTVEAKLVARVLGARHVAQAALVMAHPSRRVLGLGAAADAAHALTAVAYGASGPGRLRAGLISGGVATSFALDGLRRLRH